MKRLKKFIDDNTNDYLLLDGLVPSLTMGLVKEELILYNIPISNYQNIIDTFKKFADKNINTETLISELSHGQRILLSAIIALYSPAEKIKFRNFFTSLNESKRILINNLIEQKRNENKTIEIITD